MRSINDTIWFENKYNVMSLQLSRHKWIVSLVIHFKLAPYATLVRTRIVTTSILCTTSSHSRLEAILANSF